MTRGTWQGSGTFQTGGLGSGGLIAVVVIAAAAVAVIEFALSIIVWLAVALGAVLVLAVAALAWWLRGAPKRKAEFAAAYAAAFEARRPVRTVTAMAAPQVSHAEPPAIEQHIHYHYHAADGQEPACVIPGKVLP